MEANKRWSVPSWDMLFAGRKASPTRVREEEREEGTEAEGEGEHQVALVARQGQGQMEKELQGALRERVPGSLKAPSQAHLADVGTLSFDPSEQLRTSSALATFPKVIRKSQDGVGYAQSSASTSELAAMSSTVPPNLTSALKNLHPEEGKVGVPARPQEAWRPKTSETTAQVRPFNAVQRAGREISSGSHEWEATDTLTASTSDRPSGQWAVGAAPSSSSGRLDADDGQADLWETLRSLFGPSPSSNSNGDEESREGFLGAVSRLQSILGDGTGGEGNARKGEEKGEIARALQQASQTGDSRIGGSTTLQDESGIRHQPTYLSPRLPIVFAHGLFGFDEFSLAPAALREALPSLSVVYWRGIADTLKRRGVEVLVAKVPMSASIQERAESLREIIEKEFPHREINLIGHSMGGLDGRYLVSQLDSTFTIRSLTTIATPHRGSTFADFMLDRVVGQERLPSLLKLIEKAGLPGGGRAFECLTVASMRQFNEVVHDREGCVYMSWGAACQPGFFHEFRIPYGIIKEAEGDNDGLVSVESSKWADYRGTLTASHLDLIGWTNRVASLTASIGPGEKPFDPKALYLTICEDLAMRGL